MSNNDSSEFCLPFEVRSDLIFSLSLTLHKNDKQCRVKKTKPPSCFSMLEVGEM